MNKTRVLVFVVVSILLIFLSGCGDKTASISNTSQEAAGSRVITDMAGRTVLLPQQLKKVYPVSPVEAIMLYTIDPELLAGWSYHMASDEVRFILPKYRDLPVVSWIDRGSTGNIEEIIKTKPDAILLMTDITEVNKKFADDMEQLTQIPVIMLDKDLPKMEQAFLVAGKALDREAQTAELAQYCRETFAMVQAKKPLVAERKPIGVYYAEGRGGLETEPRGSWHAEIIEFVGGVNVADSDLPASGKIGRSPVSLEQVMNWNPEVVLIGYFRDGESSSFPQIISNQEWRDIRAVRDRRVYEIPTAPFNWFDRPPAVNRLIGIRWVANVLYPDIYPFDFRAEVKRFYSLFYHYQLSDQEVDQLANRASVNQ
ncbi:MAG: periplasmic binding protein [Firmicutes bacterium]|nr:periplasmic binding protein [Bacillota bacterium]